MKHLLLGDEAIMRKGDKVEGIFEVNIWSIRKKAVPLQPDNKTYAKSRN